MRTFLLSALLLLALLHSGCISQKETSSHINVITTIAPLGEFVRAVGGDRVAVAVLVPPGAEPHTYEPTPSQMREVAEADLYVANGVGLESWMASILEVNPRMLVVDTSTGVPLLEKADDANEMTGAVDLHIWLSPGNAAVQVQNICQALIEVDPAGRDYYANNTEEYIAELRALDAKLNSTFAGTSKKKFIVLHPAWIYFARDYGLDQISIEEEQKEPGPRYLAEIVDQAKANNITTVFVEPQYNPKMAEVIAKEINGSVVSIDDLSPNYIDNLSSVGEKIAASLRP